MWLFVLTPFIDHTVVNGRLPGSTLGGVCLGLEKLVWTGLQSIVYTADVTRLDIRYESSPVVLVDRRSGGNTEAKMVEK